MPSWDGPLRALSVPCWAELTASEHVSWASGGAYASLPRTATATATRRLRASTQPAITTAAVLPLHITPAERDALTARVRRARGPAGTPAARVPRH